MTGKVKWYNEKKGFGMIEAEDGRQIFVHSSAITGAKTLGRDQKVGFDITRGPKGIRVSRVKVMNQT
jgi:cold shock protein